MPTPIHDVLASCAYHNIALERLLVKTSLIKTAINITLQSPAIAPAVLQTLESGLKGIDETGLPVCIKARRDEEMALVLHVSLVLNFLLVVAVIGLAVRMRERVHVDEGAGM